MILKLGTEFAPAWSKQMEKIISKVQTTFYKKITCKKTPFI